MPGRFHFLNENLEDETECDDGWEPIGPAVPDATAALSQYLAECCQSENLMVLTGLGTSLEVTSSEGTPVFPTMRALWEAIAAEAVVFDRVCEIVNYATPSYGDDIELLLSRCQLSIQLGVAEVDVVREFVGVAESLILRDCGVVPEAESLSVHEAFLLRLLQRSPRRPRLELFTTNYDLCFELAAAGIRAQVIDGFGFTAPNYFVPDLLEHDIVRREPLRGEPEYAQSVLKIFKLHGSVNWSSEGGHIHKVTDTSSPMLIYPRGSKYELSYTQPFLEMMARYQAALRKRDATLIVVGCGFNDRHVVEPIMAAVRSNAALRLVVVSPELSPVGAQGVGGADAVALVERNSFLKKLDQLTQHGDRRITMINATLAELVQLIPIMPARSQADQHEERIRQLESLLGERDA